MLKENKKQIHQGLSKEQVEQSRKERGTNALSERELEGFFTKMIDSIKDDKAMQALIAALLANVVMLLTGTGSLADVIGISVAIMVAIGVEVTSEMKQEAKAEALRKSEMEKELVKVYREGVIEEISINDIVVGDYVILQAGDNIPADGVLIEGSIKVDQAALNGETEEAKKLEMVEGATYDKKDLFNEYYVYRGTVVMDGETVMLVEEVGDKTEYGLLAQEVQEDTRITPLKLKLNNLTDQITKFGFTAGALVGVAYLIQVFALSGEPVGGITEIVQHLINAFGLGVVIIVMAVPEGLPMMTALVLSMNMNKMQKDNVLVEKPHGVETAGGVNIQFSDKTGTITQGVLSVVEVVTPDLKEIDRENPAVLYGMGVNNSSVVAHKTEKEIRAEEEALEIAGGRDVEGAKANIDRYKITGGNSTDRAVMGYIRKVDLVKEIESIRDGVTEGVEVKEYKAFDSTKKSACVVVEREGKEETYIKGAPEAIIENSTRCRINGEVVPLTEEIRGKIDKYTKDQAERSMRLLGVASNEGNNDCDNLILEAILCIRDDVREEAKQAIKQVQDAGIQVVMVTGDRKETALAISKEAGIITDKQDVVLTSQELREKTDEEVKEILPRLAVVSRALPTDKSRLVRLAQENGLVVGMTGDGLNDSPALKAADVGFAMGSGTAVAKSAGDITILDDNFLSIGKAILYGRTITKSIRKFIIFQLTVNVSAVAVSLLAPFLGFAQPISIVTMLYINLVMDTLAALAFGGEPALERYMEEEPISREESIVTKAMGSQVLTIGAFITIGSLIVLRSEGLQQFYAGTTDISVAFKETAMIVFFMSTVILNGFYARTENYNVFENIEENKRFLTVMGLVAVMLVVLVEILGPVAGLVRIPVITWVKLIGLALLSIPVDMVRKTIVNKR